MDQIWISRIFKLLKLVAMKKVPSVRYQSTREIPDGSDLMIMFIQQEMGTGELDYQDTNRIIRIGLQIDRRFQAVLRT